MKLGEMQMADFQQAIKWLKEGKKVRRSSWGNKTLYGYGEDFIHFSDEGGDSNAHFLNEVLSLEATDWEIYEELKVVKESLSDKIERIEFPNGVFHEVCYTDAIKEKVQNAQRRLKEAFPEVINIEELMTSLHPPVMIDAIFKEEFGDKIIRRSK